MILATQILGAMTWSPGFKGILTVVLAVAILCGSVALILGTNSGARLGFLIALCGLAGWMAVMGVIWSVYGIGYVGAAPSWELVETVEGDPDGSSVTVVHQLVNPDALPDPVEVRDQDPEMLEAFPVTGRDPNLGDLVSLDPALREEVNETVGDWKILETSNGYTGETQSVVAEALGPEGQGLFDSASDFKVVETFVTGGKTGRTDNSIIGRIKYKFTSALEFDNDPFYAAVQVQAVVPQTTKPGQAPPLPVADEDAPIYTVVLERDRGARRLPAITFTILSAAVFGITANMLHRRDKLATAQRAAAPAGA